jgi:hypothetical protein
MSLIIITLYILGRVFFKLKKRHAIDVSFTLILQTLKCENARLNNKMQYLYFVIKNKRLYLPIFADYMDWQELSRDLDWSTH